MVRNIYASGSWLINDQSSTPHIIILPRLSHSRFYATDKLYPIGIFIIAHIPKLIQVFRHFFTLEKYIYNIIDKQNISCYNTYTIVL